jgi:demethylmenaquinone methyltransferase/2-methoxy-6-polyprenyl-1,4-benzoquinol methylase
MDGAVEIRGLDFCPSFLEYARARTRAEGFSIDFAEGDAGAMPFPDSFFDAVGLAFAFRNLTYRNARSALYLSEILRVLRPRGRLVFVETSQPGLELFKFFNHLYLRLLVPAAGRLLAGGTKAYDYLAESVAGYYTREELARLLEGAGFIEVTTVPLCLGAVALVTARKPS